MVKMEVGLTATQIRPDSISHVHRPTDPSYSDLRRVRRSGPDLLNSFPSLLRPFPERCSQRCVCITADYEMQNRHVDSKSLGEDLTFLYFVNMILTEVFLKWFNLWVEGHCETSTIRCVIGFDTKQKAEWTKM